MVARVAARVAAKGRNKAETKPGTRVSKRNAAKVGVSKPLTQQKKYRYRGICLQYRKRVLEPACIITGYLLLILAACV